MADQPQPELTAATERQALDHATLEGLADGVLTVSADGRIRTLNPAGARLLGLEPAEAIGASLHALLPEDGSGDAFLDAVLAPVAGEAEAGGSVAYGARRLAVRSRAHRLTQGPDAGRLVLTASFTDVTELERLAQAEQALAAQLREQNAQLQTAFRELEAAHEQMRTTGRRIQMARTVATGGVFLLFLAAGLYAWKNTGVDLFPSSGPAMTADSVVVAPRPVTSRIAVVGALDAGQLVNVVGPFDGLVRSRSFRYGGAVQRGEPLLVLDTGETEVRLREARSAEIRARQRVEELRGWANGFEAARARRALAAAEMEAGDLRTRVGQSATLLARGIIPAEEHRNLVQQQRNQLLQMQAARQDLDSTLARGDSEHLRIAEFELANAETKVRELEQDIAQAAVLAPVSGVVLLPPDPPGGGRPQTVEVGSRVQRGQTVFTIGDLETFQVRAMVDEIDVTKLRLDQPVEVTGDAFSELTLRGRVASIAAQASSEGGSRSGLPSFAVTVVIEGITPEQRPRLAVGMSANLSIITHDNPAAIVLPAEAVQEGPAGRFVRLRQGGAVREVPVTIGIATPDGIEVRGALNPGDIVLLGVGR